MKDENKIEVHKIEIKIGDKTISLKPEQAKELKKILNEMFEEKQVVHHHHSSYWWNNDPWRYISPSPYWTVTCGGATGISSTTSAISNCTNAASNTVCLALTA